MLNLLQQVKAPLQQLNAPLFDQKIVNVFIKREDLIHPNISGNKWRKLKYNLIEAKSKGYKTLLSFGGAYSNHIHALAHAGNLLGFKTIGCIRGEENKPLNPTLSSAIDCNMELHYIDRVNYREKTSERMIKELHQLFGDFYLVPEGGTNEFAIKGCKEIIDDFDFIPDYTFTGVGTGGTMSGLISGLNDRGQIIGVSSLKGGAFLKDDIKNLTGNQYNNWDILTNYHFGGYAKTKPELFEFIKTFYKQHHILLDPVYSSKMVFAFYELLTQNYFKPSSSIVLVHTGGLQGWKGMIEQNRIPHDFRDEVLSKYF